MGGLCWAEKCYPGRYPQASPWPIKPMNAGDMLRRYFEGQNVEILYRWAENQSGQLPELARELAGRTVAAIVASGGPAVTFAARAFPDLVDHILNWRGMRHIQTGRSRQDKRRLPCTDCRW